MSEAGTRDPDQIKAEIDATREQLRRTVDELGARLNVPAHARERAYRARDTVVETYRESPPIVIGAVALVGLVVGVVILRRKRATQRRKR